MVTGSFLQRLPQSAGIRQACHSSQLAGNDAWKKAPP